MLPLSALTQVMTQVNLCMNEIDTRRLTAVKSQGPIWSTGNPMDGEILVLYDGWKPEEKCIYHLTNAIILKKEWKYFFKKKLSSLICIYAASAASLPAYILVKNILIAS